jgi:hypothetical protein
VTLVKSYPKKQQFKKRVSLIDKFIEFFSIIKPYIFKLGTIDGFTTGAISSSKVATLAHETWNNSVEARTFVGQVSPLFSSAQSSEVFSSFWNSVGIYILVLEGQFP